MATLYIHIGTHKTGSSAIQTTISQNLQNHFANKKLGIIEAKFAAEIMKVTHPNQELITNIIQNYSEQLQKDYNRGMDKYLLTAETLSGDPMTGYLNSSIVAKTLKEVTQKLPYVTEVKIIVFIRRQDDFIESMYNQMIKQGKSYEFDHMLSSYTEDSLNWEKFIHNFEENFGSENIIVRRYGKGFQPTNSSIIEQFYDILGVKEFTLPKQQEVNPSLSRSAFEIMKLLNKELDIQNDKSYLRLLLQNASPKKSGDSYTFFQNNDARKTFYEKFASSNKAIAQKYFNEDNLFEEDTKDYKTYEKLSFEDTISIIFKILIMQSQDSNLQTNTIQQIIKSIQR